MPNPIENLSPAAKAYLFIASFFPNELDFDAEKVYEEYLAEIDINKKYLNLDLLHEDFIDLLISSFKTNYNLLLLEANKYEYYTGENFPSLREQEELENVYIENSYYDFIHNLLNIPNPLSIKIYDTYFLMYTTMFQKYALDRLEKEDMFISFALSLDDAYQYIDDRFAAAIKQTKEYNDYAWNYEGHIKSL